MSGRDEGGKDWILDAISTGGLSLIGGSPRPAAPAAEADLREQIARALEDWTIHSWLDVDRLEMADAVLALTALQRLVEQAAEAARLRETVARVEALAAREVPGDRWHDEPQPAYVRATAIRRALDGTDG